VPYLPFSPSSSLTAENIFYPSVDVNTPPSIAHPSSYFACHLSYPHFLIAVDGGQSHNLKCVTDPVGL